MPRYEEQGPQRKQQEPSTTTRNQNGGCLRASDRLDPGKELRACLERGGPALAPGPSRRHPCASAEFGEEARPYGGGWKRTRRRGSPRTGPQTAGGTGA
ncbi:hypothetical protein NDU88_009075 [Pleurodeles waltl]|uniref:Uncharacterized protein n=1 Tax=Pleurodeles waltl TaxID=8319 RepID=A0AAV7PRQ6_PLEWA|nr:hypothetical protein NDU88_009075 [Pleurodeles waltl]